MTLSASRRKICSSSRWIQNSGIGSVATQDGMGKVIGFALLLVQLRFGFEGGRVMD